MDSNSEPYEVVDRGLNTWEYVPTTTGIHTLKITTGEYDLCDLTVDDFLSEESENPVQNKVITVELNKKLNKTDNIPIDELP